MMSLRFDGREAKRPNVRREQKKIALVDHACIFCGHGRAFRYIDGRLKCTRCGRVV